MLYLKLKYCFDEAVCMHAHVHIRVNVYMCMHACMHIRVNVCICPCSVHVCACTHVRTCVGSIYCVVHHRIMVLHVDPQIICKTVYTAEYNYIKLII